MSDVSYGPYREGLEITIDVTGVNAFLQEKTSAIRLALAARMTAVSTILQSKVVGDKLSGQLLNRRTGKLSDSVRIVETKTSDTEISGGYTAGGGPVNYAASLEYGSVAHIITAVNKKALAFGVSAQNNYSPWGGAFSAKSDTLMVIVKSVHHPGTRAYAFMRGTLAENADTIKAEFQDAANEAAKS